MKLESPDDLFVLLRQLPEQEKFAALGVLNKMQKGKIDHIQATAELKQLFLRSGLAVEVSE